ncbi:MAG TPA: hypothetical protein VG498_06840, partial [Terriglobales bacterium]|nr:hypothetical protein [Terriglobales bacterium]
MDSNTKIEYAAARDFCSIFHNQMASFYQLAFLLTADRDAAEHVFVAALEECLNGIAVFKERASSWSRRVIVTNAIRAAAPVSFQTSNAWAQESSSDSEAILHFSEKTITRLSPFTRFVFVMTVLEKFSVTESAVLLRSSRKAVVNAQLRAISALAQQAPAYIPEMRAAASIILAKSSPTQCPDLHREMTLSEMT